MPISATVASRKRRDTYPITCSKCTSRALSPKTARNRSSSRFMFWVLHRDAVQAKQVAVLGDHLARQLHSGLLRTPTAKENAQKLGAGERLRTLREQALARPELRRELLHGVAAPHTEPFYYGAALSSTAGSRIPRASSPRRSGVGLRVSGSASRVGPLCYYGLGGMAALPGQDDGLIDNRMAIWSIKLTT